MRSRGAAARPTDRDRAHYERECAALKELAVQFHHCDTKAVDATVARSGCGLWDGRYRTSPARKVNNGRKKKLDEILDAPTDDGDESYRISISA